MKRASPLDAPFFFAEPGAQGSGVVASTKANPNSQIANRKSQIDSRITIHESRLDYGSSATAVFTVCAPSPVLSVQANTSSLSCSATRG
jgi:hypothetical protein